MRYTAFTWSIIAVSIFSIIGWQIVSHAEGQTTENSESQQTPRKFNLSGSGNVTPLTQSTNSNAQRIGNLQLVAANEAEITQSSRRRAVSISKAPPQEINLEEKSDSATSPGVKLPTSLDEALSRLKDYPLNNQDTKENTASKSNTVVETQAPTKMPTPAEKGIPASIDNVPQANAPVSIGSQTQATASQKPQPVVANPGPSRFQSLPGRTPQTQTPVQSPRVASLPPRPVSTVMSDDLLAITSPNIAVTTQGPKSIVIGKKAIYVIQAKNNGVTDVKNLIVRIRLPQSIQLMGQQASVGKTFGGNMQNTGSVNWEIPLLPARSAGKIQLELIPNSSAPFDLGVEVIYAAGSSSRAITILEPKLQMKIEGEKDVLFGQSRLYKIIMANPGTGIAENVGLTLMPLKQGQQPTTFDKIGNIPPGEQKVIEVELTAKQAGQIMIQAKCFADGNLRADAAQAVLVRRANIQLIAQGPPVKYAATEATYSLNLQNTGNANAEQVTAKATLPVGAKFVAATSGGTFDQKTNTVHWKLAKLEASKTHPLQISCILMQGGNNTITAQCATVDGLTATKSLTTLVESLADLKLHVNDPKGPIPVGEEISYEFRLENRGTKAAEGINIAVNFSTGILPTSAKGTKATIEGSSVKFVQLDRLEAGKEMILTVKAKASAAGSHSFRAEVLCNDPVTKLASEETTRFYASGSISNTVPNSVPSQARQQGPAPLLPLPYRGLR